MKKKRILAGLLVLSLLFIPSMSVGATCDSSTLTIPASKGKLTSNAWRSVLPKISGNTYKWNYVVSAKYSGKKKVSSIKTSWYGSASLRNSASISLGISDSSVSAGASYTWRYVKTKTKYWNNTNGAKIADYSSNMIVSPRRDYRDGTISIINVASVKLKGDSKTYQISAGC
ncbi:MAG: hypothetical protein LBM02_06675 [Lachnospiraceae bacterium]|jgi:hypothetical protein|nr:hypothetical protein [Lachnospiraceae bacterium]